VSLCLLPQMWSKPAHPALGSQYFTELVDNFVGKSCRGLRKGPPDLQCDKTMKF
jgi:hypothetical protein